MPSMSNWWTITRDKEHATSLSSGCTPQGGDGRTRPERQPARHGYRGPRGTHQRHRQRPARDHPGYGLATGDLFRDWARAVAHDAVEIRYRRAPAGSRG